ncbi:glycoside hydrolase family 43 protein [Desertivirga xinjiangensis]|uniref:glycoside hydrolase family 43 protein n=1 Tax=Desertivirga xinjiangensis TaxID=539206 RepID=UPI00210F0E2F|nr:glycoside hydrolase family 43 protein [Pedobacter xinjiangensis]
MIIRNRNTLRLLFASFLWIAIGVNCGKQSSAPEVIQPVNTFTNPLVQGSDPWVYQKNGTYYYLQTEGNSIRLRKTTSMSQLASSVSTTIYQPVPGNPNSRNIWAPEMFFLDNKWYIYYTAGDGTDLSQRTWVLENANADPITGTWTDKGRLSNSNANFWAIDGTIMEYNNNRYFIWSGRPDVSNVNLTQNLYISKMTNPWTLEGPATLISRPDLTWERNGFGVNEAPEVLVNPGNTYFITYSASYCGTDDYALGLLTLKEGGNPVTSTDWTKHPNPVFIKKPSVNAYGPGHNSFFKSKDGTEHWMIYHANSNSGEGCGDKRNIRMQKITFNPDGFPNFGEPVATGLQINKPSGE